MTKNIPHIAMLDKSVTHLAEGLNLLHTKLSNLYTLLNRPLDSTSQNQALTLLHDSMKQLRNLQEDKNYIINSAAGFDSDLGDLTRRINELRIQRAMPMEAVDEKFPSTLYTPSPLRQAANELDDLIQRGGDRG